MISKEIIRAIATGKVIFGHRQVLKKTEEAKAFIISKDCPTKQEVMAHAQDKPVYIYRGNNVELGSACGKPFGVSVLAIVDEGKSNILNMIKG
ncbi:MAG TPA: 50S ribosomal protein L30e [Thermoplasmatales archaeon]|nr:MAG: 50S ribosomal protein L30e [Thermoplasmata archaeon]HDN50847.1 50S ribosomal protein L30e [Thermoplasmatales archaeon]